VMESDGVAFVSRKSHDLLSGGARLTWESARRSGATTPRFNGTTLARALFNGYENA
jgi:hypothetical protein